MFDKFAAKASDFVASALFFTACVLLVLVWLPSFLIIRDIDTWQLIINTLTTIVTFLMVALLENSHKRSDVAIHLKLDRILEGLEELPDTTTSTLADAVEVEKQ